MVLTSISSARRNAIDSSIKSQMGGMLSAAERIYLTTGTFDTVCSATSESGKLFAAAFAQSTKTNAQHMCLSSGTTGVYSTANTLSPLAKAASPGRWAAVMLLKNGKYYCVDSTGASKEQTGRVLDNTPLVIKCS